MTKTLLILAGGASSRMKNSEDKTLSYEMQKQANSRSKALIILNDRPMLDYVLYNAKKAGITNVIIVIHPEGLLFKEYYGTHNRDNNFHNLNISYATQYIPSDRQKPLGTADAVLQAIEQFPNLKKEEFLVCNSDNLYSSKAMHLLRTSSARNAFIAYERDALCYPMERIARFALVQLDKNGFLVDIIEKPEGKEISLFKGLDATLRVSMNIFKFYGLQMYAYLKNCPLNPQRNEKEIPTAIINLIKNTPKSVKAISLSEHVPDLTGKNDINMMNAYLAQHIPTLDWE